ncbi:hypothetical protein QYE76_045368 [Lolium multiflorum]|uniref:DUF4283 domain-containing protein n=1 Tax=Lolium multiflorum TaxID=4521 RepID=A0AAD8TKX3_LOLMU|nr:hypothetical protein QYE76_045368 [Lolium multiflorum]
MASVRSGARGGGSSRPPSRSPAKAGAEELAAGLSAKTGDLLLTDKEATGLVIKNSVAASVPKPKWTVVGKVCSPRKLVIGALEKAMHRAWGLHRPAFFKDLGENRFVVRFTSEGDWYHVLKKGPWQFDFNVVLIKDYDGSVRPSDMVFDTLELWVRVLDLPMDKMNKLYGQLIGDWVGKFIKVEVDEDGFAWGKDLRIRVAVKVDQPLIRGVFLKDGEEDEEGTWFDIKYDKIPHFCFYCGCLVHKDDMCSAEKVEEPQWGEWLRSLPQRIQKQPGAPRPAVSSSSFSGRSSSSDVRGGTAVRVRDLPLRRNLGTEFAYSSSSRTGGNERRRVDVEVSSPEKRHWAREHDRAVDHNAREPAGLQSWAEERRGENDMQEKAPRNKQGKYTRRARKQVDAVGEGRAQEPPGMLTRKRGPKQVWVPVPVQVVGEDTSGSAGKRQRTNVFERIQDPRSTPEGQRTSSVFDRIEDPAADPAAQGRREQ